MFEIRGKMMKLNSRKKCRRKLLKEKKCKKNLKRKKKRIN
jgi:hypothetical protein